MFVLIVLFAISVIAGAFAGWRSAINHAGRITDDLRRAHIKELEEEHAEHRRLGEMIEVITKDREKLVAEISNAQEMRNGAIKERDKALRAKKLADDAAESMYKQIEETKKSSSALVNAKMGPVRPVAPAGYYWEEYQNTNNQWRWRVKAGNHEIVASGESYHNRGDMTKIRLKLFPGLPVKVVSGHEVKKSGTRAARR